MAKKPQRNVKKDNTLAALWRSDLGKRLLGLAGLGIIVGAVIGVIAAAGLLGSQGGGTVQVEEQTEEGETVVREVPIGEALVFDPPPSVGEYDVGVGVGKLARDFEVSDFEGNRLRLSDFRGRPVYLNFWASWCTPCIVELPDIAALMARHPDLVTIGVNRAEPLGQAERFLDSIRLKDGRQGMRFTANALDPDDTLYDEYRGLGMPVSIFVDANGYVTFVWNGLLLLSQMEEVLAETVQSAAESNEMTAPVGN